LFRKCKSASRQHTRKRTMRLLFRGRENIPPFRITLGDRCLGCRLVHSSESRFAPLGASIPRSGQ
jgi:hypothetical protein